MWFELRTLHMLGIWLWEFWLREWEQIFYGDGIFCSRMIEHLRWFIIFLHIFDISVSFMCFEILAYSTLVIVFDLRIYVVFKCSLFWMVFSYLFNTVCLVEGICYSTSYGITSNSIKLPIDGRRWHDLASTRCLYIACWWLFTLIQKIEWSVWKSIHPSLAYGIVIVLHVGLFNLSLLETRKLGKDILYLFASKFRISMALDYYEWLLFFPSLFIFL